MAKQKWKEWAENEERLTVLSAWARAGLTNEEIAGKIGISRSTLTEWKKKYKPIREAIDTGKEIADRMVEDALYRLALGYTIKVRKAFKLRNVTYKDGKREKEEERLETIEEDLHVKPDVKAIMFYLENRVPDRWSRKAKEASGDDEGAGIVVLTTAQIEQLRKEVEDDKETE